MTLVKICGIREPAHAVAAAEAGADYIGMILAPGRRRITLEQAAKITAAVRAAAKSPPKLVGVFVNADPAEVNDMAAAAGLDMVQLSGQEDEDYLERIALPKIKAIHVDSATPGPVGWLSLRRRLTALRAMDVLPLLDAQVDGQAGGTGRTFDWSAAKGQDGIRFMVAGGLTPENVAGAIAQLHPWAVDVSSGVETAGVKDMGKVRAFIQAVRQAGQPFPQSEGTGS